MKRIFLISLTLSFSLTIQSQLKKVDIGNKTIFLPKLKGYHECAGNKLSKPYKEALLPEKMNVLGFYTNDMAFKYPEFNFFYKGTNDCLMFMVNDFLVNENVESNVFEEIILKTMDSLYGEKNNQLYEALKKEHTFHEELLPKPLTLINAYSVQPNTKTYVFAEPASYNEIRCSFNNYILIENKVVEFMYSLTLYDETFLALSESNNNYFLKCLLEVNNIPLSDELKNVHSKTLETQLLDNFYTKDGYNMGSKKMFINKVTKEVSELEFSGLKIDGSKVWDCIIEHKVPTLNTEAFLKLLKKDISKLFPTDENEIDALMSCVGDGFSIGESYVELCKKRYLNAGFSTFESTSYCDCEYEKLKEKVVDYQAFKKYYSEIGDEHKDSYNEVILPCRNLVEKKRMSNNYNPEDIEGFSDESFIKLTASGSTFKIKLVIEGVSRYFTFDSGASELIINADLEKELLDKKLISASNYVKSKSFSTADGSIVNAKGLILNNIVIGGFKVHNVTAYITDKGGMLCGMGLLNKFKNWEFDKDQSMLVIYK